MTFRKMPTAQNRYAKPNETITERRGEQQRRKTQIVAKLTRTNNGYAKTTTTKNEIDNAQKNPMYQRETTTKINKTTTTTASSET